MGVSITSYGQQELPYTKQGYFYQNFKSKRSILIFFKENAGFPASDSLSDEFDHEIDLLENEVENEVKSFLKVEKEENEEIKKLEENKKNKEKEEDSNLSPPPQTLQILNMSLNENQEKHSETQTLTNLAIDDITKPQLQTQKSTDCEQKLFDQIRSKSK